MDNVTFWPREKDGRLTPVPEEEKPVEEMTKQEKFFFFYQRKGYPDWRIDELWDAKNGPSSQSQG